jgi:hypothetical protein
MLQWMTGANKKTKDEQSPLCRVVSSAEPFILPGVPGIMRNAGSYTVARPANIEC